MNDMNGWTLLEGKERSKQLAESNWVLKFALQADEGEFVALLNGFSELVALLLTRRISVLRV